MGTSILKGFMIVVREFVVFYVCPMTHYNSSVILRCKDVSIIFAKDKMVS